MNASRLAGIPIDHVVAEIASYPFSTTASFSIRPIELDPNLDGCTAQLWRRAEGSLVGSFPAFSVDEFLALRDRMWFGDRPTGATPLHTYLRRLAHCFLVDQGSFALPSLPKTDRWVRSNPNVHSALARRAWRWLSLAMPADLLLGALGDHLRGPSRVQMLTPALETHLADHGFAEVHIHVGAALDFEQLWAVAMRSIAQSELHAGAFRSPGAVFNEGKDFGPWLVRVAIIRVLLALFLRHANTRFLEYLHSSLRKHVVKRFGSARFSSLLRVIADFETGQLSGQVEFPLLQSLYTQIGQIHANRSACFSDPQDTDPIASKLNQFGNAARSPEVRLIARGLDYLDQIDRIGDRDFHFNTLFWQMVRVRSLFFRHVVHRPLTPGLQWFVRFYDRGRPGRLTMGKRTLFESARRICGGDHGLRSLEIRTTPESSRAEQQRYVEAVAQAGSLWQKRSVNNGGERSSTTELGLVLHFIKTRGGGISSGKLASYWRSTHADPRANYQTSRGAHFNLLANFKENPGNPTGYRYAHYYEKRRKEAMTVEWLFRHRPLSLEILRGFDVCTDEVGVPSWVIAPLLQRVKAAAEDGAQLLETYTGYSSPLPRTTAHAGEDFVHLLTGIRLLDEAVESFKLGAGDRIGHGLSLGLDPVEWVQRAGRVLIAREDRLFDLVWEWKIYAVQGGCPDTSRLSFLNREIPRLCTELFGQPVYDAHDIENLWSDLNDPWELYRVGFPNGPSPRTFSADKRLKLLQLYLMDAEVFRRGRQLIWVETSPESEVLSGLQSLMRRKIGQIGISVEVNPTSNLLIGDLNELTRHPLWRLLPVDASKTNTPPVSICVGSDDPLVFNSNLRQEYQSLCDAMILAGHSEEEIRQWISRTREIGMESRFTLKTRCDSILDWFVNPEVNLRHPI